MILFGFTAGVKVVDIDSLGSKKDLVAFQILLKEVVFICRYIVEIWDRRSV
jgi:hypothetical protein